MSILLLEFCKNSPFFLQILGHFLPMVNSLFVDKANLEFWLPFFSSFLETDFLRAAHPGPPPTELWKPLSETLMNGRLYV